MNTFSCTGQQDRFVGESLNWCECDLTLVKFKNNCFLAQDLDGGNTFVIWAKNLLRPNFMKSEVLEQLKHYFWEISYVTLEPVEWLAGNLKVISVNSEGIWLEAFADSAVVVHLLLQMPWHWTLCCGPGVCSTFVSLCAFIKKCLYGSMFGGMIV